VGVPKEVHELGRDAVMFEEFPGDLSVYNVTGLFIVNKVDVERGPLLY